eukprot:6190767-Pleurochrysis_carterae.AAC.1
MLRLANLYNSERSVRRDSDGQQKERDKEKWAKCWVNVVPKFLWITRKSAQLVVTITWVSWEHDWHIGSSSKMPSIHSTHTPYTVCDQWSNASSL